MLGSNSSPRTERAPAYGCPNQNPRHAANELAAQTHWGPRQDCRCGWASGTLVRGSDTNSPTQADRQGAADIRPIFQKSFALLRERSWQCAEWNFVRRRYLAHLSWARSALQAEPNHRNRLGACCPDSASYACRTENDWRLSEF